MSLIGRKLAEVAEQLATGAKQRAASLEEEYLALKAQAADKEAERDLARGAEQRSLHFRSALGTDLICPICWIDRANRAPMKPIAGDDRHDVFRCGVCHFEVSVEA